MKKLFYEKILLVKCTYQIFYVSKMYTDKSRYFFYSITSQNVLSCFFFFCSLIFIRLNYIENRYLLIYGFLKIEAIILQTYNNNILDNFHRLYVFSYNVSIVLIQGFFLAYMYHYLPLKITENSAIWIFNILIKVDISLRIEFYFKLKNKQNEKTTSNSNFSYSVKNKLVTCKLENGMSNLLQLFKLLNNFLLTAWWKYYIVEVEITNNDIKIFIVP